MALLEQFSSWVRASVDSAVQQGGLAVGLFSSEEVAEDSEASLGELVKRFVGEACNLKDGAAFSQGYFSCGSSPIVEGHRGIAGPSADSIREVIPRWSARVAGGEARGALALNALLQSSALDIAITAFTRSKAGRETLKQAASHDVEENISGFWEILTRAAAVSPDVMKALLQVVADGAETLAQGRALLTAQPDAREMEHALQWPLALFSAALFDSSEATLYAKAQPVITLERAAKEIADLGGNYYDFREDIDCSGGTGPESESAGSTDGVVLLMASIARESWDQQLAAIEVLSRAFQEIHAICENLHAVDRGLQTETGLASMSSSGSRGQSQSKSTGAKGKTQRKVSTTLHVCGADIERALACKLHCVAAARKEIENRTHGNCSVKLYLEGVSSVSLQVEASLAARMERVRHLSAGLSDLHNQTPSLIALCLSSERLRRFRFRQLLACLQRKIWGAESLWNLAGNVSEIASLREIVKRAAGLIEQAWREMVAVAAETLSDSSPFVTKSEEMSRAAKQCREMKQEVLKNMARLTKLETEQPPPARPQETPAPQAESQEGVSTKSPVSQLDDHGDLEVSTHPPTKPTQLGSSSNSLLPDAPAQETRQAYQPSRGVVGELQEDVDFSRTPETSAEAISLGSPDQQSGSARSADEHPAENSLYAHLRLCPLAYWHGLHARFLRIPMCVRLAEPAVCAIEKLLGECANRMHVEDETCSNFSADSCPASYWSRLHGLFKQKKCAPLVPLTLPSFGEAFVATPNADPQSQQAERASQCRCPPGDPEVEVPEPTAAALPVE